MEIPSSLKPISPFLAKAKETEKADPIVSYHCKLYAAQQIVDQGLHQQDTQAAVFTGNLLDDIEKLKDEDPVLMSEKGQAVISDDAVACSYLEAFALKIFAKADKQAREQSSTKATAQTFFAAATFFEICKLFGELDKDVAEKIKYAKFHAARILRAIKSGEDPNDFVFEDETEEEYEEEVSALPEEEQVRRMMEEMKKEVGQSEQSEGVSLGDPIDNDDPFSSIPPPPPTFLPDDNLPPAPPKDIPSSTSPPPTLPSPQRKLSSSARPKPAVPAPTPAPVDPVQVLDEDALIKQVQKHAKFAISALNYEDKNTAIKELQAALDLLTT